MIRKSNDDEKENKGMLCVHLPSFFFFFSATTTVDVW